MMYIIEKGELKKVTPTNKNIEELRGKRLYSIQSVFTFYYAVFKWNERGHFWQQISKAYTSRGWCLNYLKKIK